MQEIQQAYISTNEFARALGVQGGTVRRGLCVHGHYLGSIPRKLPNNRLLWLEEDLKRIISEAQIGA